MRDGMMEGPGSKLALTVGKLVVAKLRELEEGNTLRLQEHWAVERRSWRALRDFEVERRLTALEAVAQDREAFRAAVDSMASDCQFVRLHMNLEFEAVREALEDRKRLLAYAAAGLSDPDLSIEEKARLERVLRGLDVRDIFFLREIILVDASGFAPNPQGHNSTEQQKARYMMTARLEMSQCDVQARDALVAAGCVAIDNLSVWGPGSAVVTHVGHGLVTLLEAFFAVDDQEVRGT